MSLKRKADDGGTVNITECKKKKNCQSLAVKQTAVVKPTQKAIIAEAVAKKKPHQIDAIRLPIKPQEVSSNWKQLIKVFNLSVSISYSILHSE